MKTGNPDKKRSEKTSKKTSKDRESDAVKSEKSGSNESL